MHPCAAHEDTAALWGLGFLSAQLMPDKPQAHKKPSQQLLELSASLSMESGVFAVKNLLHRQFTAPRLFGGFFGLGFPQELHAPI